MKEDDNIKVKLICSNCSNGKRLKKIIERVSLQTKTPVIINELNNKNEPKNITLV